MRTSFVPFTVILLLAPLRALPDPAHVPPPCDETARRKVAAPFEAGDKAFQVAQWAEAAERFNEAYAICPDPHLLFALGSVHARLKNWSACIDHCQRFIDALPQCADVPAARDELRRCAAQTPEVTLTSEPAGAQLQVIQNGTDEVAVPKAVTPWTGRLAAGEVYRVILRAEGYVQPEILLPVRAGEPIARHFELALDPGRLRLKVCGSGLSVVVGDETVGQSPLDHELERPPGELRVLLKGPSESLEQTVTLESGRTTELVHCAPSSPGADLRLWGWSAMSTAAVALVAGSIFKVRELDARRYHDDCRDRSCEERYGDTIRTDGAIAHASFGVGALGLAAAAALLYLHEPTPQKGSVGVTGRSSFVRFRF